MIDLPPTLVDAVREQRTVLFLGSGANHDATHPQHRGIPLGNGLRDLVCDKFFNGSLKQKPLTAVAAMATNEVGLTAFQKYIHDIFEPFKPASYHSLLPQFRWRAIATTNYDLIVERAYDGAADRAQNLVITVKDEDQFDPRLNATFDPLAYYKLHGCVDHYTDATIPLILSNEQYASYEKNRQRLWRRFRDLCYDYHVIFAGYSISDPHVQSLLFDLTAAEIGRPMFYSVSPGIDPIEARYWATHRITCIDATLKDFLESLDSKVPASTRKIPVDIGGGTLSIRSHYKIAAAIESLGLKAYLATDATHVYAGMPALPQDPRDFYRGNDSGWGCIQQNLDAKRTFVDSVLVDAILTSDDNRRSSDLFMLKGPAGNGKSVSLKRIAWEAATTYEHLVIFANNAAALSVDPIDEIYRLTSKRIILCVDHVALYRNETLALLKACRARSIPLSILGSERDNEWFTYCDQLEPFVKQEFPVRYLNEREIDELLKLLDRHNALGLLKDLDQSVRVAAFTQSAERQLLVALHEATLGKPFEDIIFDEFNRIEPQAARDLYLSICALHQFGAPVRAGLISRASGINFEKFGQNFLNPLKNVVLVIEDKHTKDVFYRSRHQHVAELVFRRALAKPEDKFDLLIDLIASINISYSSDRETFSRLIKGRGLVDIFASPELGRLFYDRAEQASPNDPFVFHQRAVFEMNHAGGALTLAEVAAKRAFELNPNSRGIRHTQGEIARRLANATDDPLKKEAFRRLTREKIGGDVAKMSEYDLYTRARLSIDELKEELENAAVHGADIAKEFATAVQDAQTSIQRGLQSFPESAELLSAEATFRELINQSAAAQAALEKAFRLNPRQDWLAARLARRHEDAGDYAKAISVLDTCLRDNPSSKVARFAKAKVLLNSRGDRGQVLENLRRSFTDGDNHYEAQFWYARELFLQDQFDLSQKIFALINEHAPGRFRNTASARIEEADGDAVRFSGRVDRLEEGYAFIRISHFPTSVFASRNESDPVRWSSLETGKSVSCNIAFSRRGARAVELMRD